MFQLNAALFSWAFAYGLLHTIQPCEDKAIFGFHAFGVARNTAEAFKIIGIYSLGLMTVNNLLGLGFASIGNILSLVPFLDNVVAFLSPVMSITVGSIMYYRLVKRGQGDNHSFSPLALKVRRSMVAVFLLGILTGLPPCPFELAIYFQALSAGGSFIWNGVFTTIFFSTGTVFGLFLLTVLFRSVKHLAIAREKSKDLVQKIAILILIGFGIYMLVATILGIAVIIPPPPVD